MGISILLYSFFNPNQEINNTNHDFNWQTLPQSYGPYCPFSKDRQQGGRDCLIGNYKYTFFNDTRSFFASWLTGDE
jgi:hypothetical protein